MEDNIIYKFLEENMDNFKFKVGDIVTGADEDQWIYGEECKITKSYLNKNGRNAYILEKSSAEWYEDELKLVENKEEIKLEKTFREVIADIKDGEVWESEFCTIEATEYNTKIRMGNASNIAIGTNVKFKLQRKQYTFTEAFKAYEEGKEIEGVYSKRKYKKDFKMNMYVNDEYFESCKPSISMKEIGEKWYINN